MSPRDRRAVRPLDEVDGATVERRRATLERRTLDDFVPRWTRIAVYAAIGLNLAAWIAVAALGWQTTSKFWGRLLFLLAMTPAFLFFPRLGVGRAPHALDRIFGSAYRRAEVRYGLAMNLVLPIVGALRLYEELAETVAFDVNRVMHLGVVLCATAGILRLARFARGPVGPDTARSLSATCAATVVLGAALLFPPAAVAQAPDSLSDSAIRALLTERVDAYGHRVGIVVGIVARRIE